MKYVCTICGYVYDEEKEKVLLKTLPIPELVGYVEPLSRPLFLEKIRKKKKQRNPRERSRSMRI